MKVTHKEKIAMLVNRIKCIFVLATFLLVVLAASGEALVIQGTHSGNFNGLPFSAEFQGTADLSTGQISLVVHRYPPWIPPWDSIPWPPHLQCGCTMVCIYSTVFAKVMGGAVNFYDILGGSGDFTHTRHFTYPVHPLDSSYATLNIHLVPDSLTFNGNWTFNTGTLPDDLKDIAEFNQYLTPMGDGLVGGSATIYVIRSTGDSVPVSFTGVWNLGPGKNLPSPETGTCSFHLTEVNDSIYTVAGVCSLRSGAVIPTLTEWGLIIFAVLLVGFMTWVVVRRRRRVTIGI